MTDDNANITSDTHWREYNRIVNALVSEVIGWSVAQCPNLQHRHTPLSFDTYYCSVKSPRIIDKHIKVLNMQSYKV